MAVVCCLLFPTHHLHRRLGLLASFSLEQSHLSRCGRKICLPRKCEIQPRLLLLVDCKQVKNKFDYMLDGERSVHSQNIDKLTEGRKELIEVYVGRDRV